MIVPAVVLLSVPFVALWAGRWHRGWGWREAMAFAAIGWMVWAIALAELLSVGGPHDLAGDDGPGWLRRSVLLAAWACVSAAALLHLYRSTGRHAWAHATRSSKLALGWPPVTRLWGGAVIAITSVVGVLALVAAPNNWDSMTYHLTRVAAWARLGAVAHYPTHVEPSLYQPPGAEIAVLHGYVLSGGDHLAALVQWGAWVGCMVLASLAARELGGRLHAQVTAALLVATMPAALLEASSTQNDLFLAFWLLLAGTFALRIWNGTDLERRTIDQMTLCAGAAIGIAVSVKGTALVYAPACALLLAAAAMRRVGVARTIGLACAAIAICTALNSGAWLRNTATFGSPLATGSLGDAYRTTSVDPATIVSNLVRNSTNHLELPLDGWNRGLEQSVRAGLGRFGIDPDDPDTTFLDTTFRVGPFVPHEDHAGNALLLLLGAWSAAMVVLTRRHRTPVLLAWLGMLIVATLMFMGLLKWQNWHARQHLTLFMAAVPMISVVLDRIQHRRVSISIVSVAVLMSPLWMFYNYSRPLVGSRSVLTVDREQQYFANRPQLQLQYDNAMAAIARTHASTIGIVSTPDDWHYPLYRAAGKRRVFDVLVTNASNRYAGPVANRDLADAVLCLTCADAWREQLTAAGLHRLRFDGDGVARGPRGDVSSVELWVRPG